MSIRFNKKVVVLTAGLTVLSSPMVSIAEEQQSVNNHQSISVQEQAVTARLQVSDEQALKSIEESFEGVDGRGGGTVDNKKVDSLQSSEGIYEETGTLTIPNNSNRTKRSLSFSAPKVSSTINGVPFTEWIVPEGNDNIRPQNHMIPKYITIHETDNKSVGAGAKNHAQYLYNQAVGNTDRAASWHFTVDDKEIYQHLPLNENGWHAGDGDGSGNRESIAIEIAVNSDGDYNKAVDNAKKLAAYLMKETGVPLNNVVKHQKWSGKNCPAIMINSGQWVPFVSGVEGYYNKFYQPTDDITGGWYESAIRDLNRRGIMVGEGNGIFAPNRSVTRAEFAQLISKSLSLPAGEATFKDLNDANPTLRDGIKRTASVGIISGRGDGYFDPNTPITREEAASIVNRALQYKGINGPLANLPFADKDQIIYKEAVQRLYGLGIVKGMGDNLYVPKGTTTRGETAAFILNMLQVIETGSVQKGIGTAEINGIGVNVRSGAGAGYLVVRKASKGEKVTVYEEKNGWLRIGTDEWIYNEPSYIVYKKDGN
ncbi:S-layer homology domain-containing protein [Bacillus thuringiensis]|uniref:S-layer homology domain-containing protein n=1 Tax=Bacillus thuringiensis TaxID=1428 RepID=UPI002223F548|nr:S-layer homology domain-containing protein [Bacillus thuringiensis]UYX52231.1 S-layer homology domain-containing protein [Bacillus thuringiensis]